MRQGAQMLQLARVMGFLLRVLLLMLGSRMSSSARRSTYLPTSVLGLSPKLAFCTAAATSLCRPNSASLVVAPWLVYNLWMITNHDGELSPFICWEKQEHIDWNISKQCNHVKLFIFAVYWNELEPTRASWPAKKLCSAAVPVRDGSRLHSFLPLHWLCALEGPWIRKATFFFAASEQNNAHTDKKTRNNETKG